MLSLEISKVTTRWTQRAEPTPGLGVAVQTGRSTAYFGKRSKVIFLQGCSLAHALWKEEQAKKVSGAIVGKHEQGTFCMTHGKLFKGTHSFSRLAVFEGVVAARRAEAGGSVNPVRGRLQVRGYK